MQYRRLFTLATAVLLAGLLAGSGCSKKPKDDEDGDVGGGGRRGGKATQKVEEVKPTEFTTLKGKVVFEGGKPKRASMKDQVEKNKEDKDYCLKDPTEDSFLDPSWKVGADDGVQDVVVFVRPAKGVFATPPADHKSVDKEDVVVDQPYCAFEPRVSVVRAGQKLVIQNSAPMTHNTDYKSPDNEGANPVIPGKKPGEDASKVGPLTLRPYANEPWRLACSVHPWMKGFVWVTDTPYAATTDKDGNFEIKNAPAGVPVRVSFWHDKVGFFGEGGKNGMEVTLTKDSHDLKSIKLKPKE